MRAILRCAVWAVSIVALTAATYCRQAEGAGPEQPVVLKNETWAVRIAPGSLETTLELPRADAVRLSAPQDGLGEVREFQQTETEATWKLGDKGLAASFRLVGDALLVHFVSAEPGRLTWPLLSGGPAVKAYVLPLFEGSYVPSEDPAWRAFLASGDPISTTEGLSMPFYGLDCGGLTLTCIVTNPFNNELAFQDDGGRLGLRLTHEFTPNAQVKECGLLVRLGGPSPIEPARQYRKWLMERGEFVSLRDKVAAVPDAAKLLGAAHVYLWGNGLISRYDVLNWKAFVANLAEQGAAPEPSPGKRVWELMQPEARKVAQEAVAAGSVSNYARGQLAGELSTVLGRRDFYKEVSWRGVGLPREAQDLLTPGTEALGEPQLYRLNSLLFQAAFREDVAEADLWGDGVSVKMMDKLAAVGLDRLWLGLDSWQGAVRHPQAIKRAKDLGYLIATYDSYESIHRPGETDTWETAQFDAALYETGAVVARNGAKVAGFEKKGYRLSSIAARPYVEKRVSGLMDTLPERLNSWFVDCDAYGDLRDDYSPLHPATEQEDMDARLARMAWIRDTYHVVVGSERGAAYAAPVIHFAHGMMTPVFGWGDPDLRTNKESPYYLGAYWPPDGPAVFMKPVPLKDVYRLIYFDPRYRLPLYETAFHDSLVATHHWSGGSLKFRDQAETVELLELLYGVPPLYHLNLAEFEKNGERIAAHYRFFSPLHRQVGLLPLTDFEWLSPDRLVQRTVFGNAVEVVANFSDAAFERDGASVPPRSVVARRLSTGEAETFTPARPAPGP